MQTKVTVISILIVLLTGLFRLSAQDAQELTDKWIESLVEDAVVRSEGEADVSELLEYLHSLRDKPLNLNHATREELEQMHILTDFQIASLLDYIKTNGELLSIYELQYVPGFSEELAAQINPFVKTSLENRPADDLQELSALPGRGYLILRTQQILEKQAGFKTLSDSNTSSLSNKYLGSPGRYCVQYRYQVSSRIFAGITATKDIGEPFFRKEKGKLPSPDFLSFHFMANRIGFIKTLALGDFQVGFGQGLTWCSGYGFGKGSSLQNIKKSRQGLRPHTSTNENRFMRGIGTTLTFGKFEFTAFLSRKHIDAHITWFDSLRNEPVYFSSFQTSGMHTTANELRDMDAILEEAAGGHISFSAERFRLGATFVRTEWNACYNPPDLPYKQFTLRGRNSDNAGIDYEARLGNFSFFGEGALCNTGGLAILNGMAIDFQHEIYFSIVSRSYGRNYFSTYSSPFAESWGGSNEQGLFTGISIKPLPRLLLTGYLDVFRFPWLKYKVSMPSSGTDILLLAQYTGKGGWDISIRYQREKGMEDISSETAGMPETGEKKKDRIRFHLSFTPQKNITMRSRIEFQRIQPAGKSHEDGFLLYHDMLYQFANAPLKLIFRYALFETGSYNSRLYTYENDILHIYSAPCYFGRGIRYYFMINWKPLPYIDLWMKYGRTIYPGQTYVGTGPARIDANHKTDLGIEIRFRF